MERRARLLETELRLANGARLAEGEVALPRVGRRSAAAARRRRGSRSAERLVEREAVGKLLTQLPLELQEAWMPNEEHCIALIEQAAVVMGTLEAIKAPSKGVL